MVSSVINPFMGADDLNYFFNIFAQLGWVKIYTWKGAYGYVFVSLLRVMKILRRDEMFLNIH